MPGEVRTLAEEKWMPDPVNEKKHLFKGERAKGGGAAGVHAFIVGVSDYTHLPEAGEPGRSASLNLHKLSSPAISAYRYFEWLKERDRENALPHQLETCRLLLAPSAAELEKAPEMANYAGATIGEFSTQIGKWRSYCAQNPKSQAIFYFCGHGIQPHEMDAILLLQDFGKPDVGSIQQHMVRVSNIFRGMAPTNPAVNHDLSRIALEQIYYIDACREQPEQLKKLFAMNGVPVFDPVLSAEEERNAPIFFSTVTGAQSFGKPGQVSVFTTALLKSLEVACDGHDQDQQGKDLWPVRARFLHKVVEHEVNKGVGTKQRLGKLQGLVGDPVVHYLPGPPELEVKVSVAPDSVSGLARVDVNNLVNPELVWSTETNAGAAHPYMIKVRLGFYSVNAKYDGYSDGTLAWQPKADANDSKRRVTLTPIVTS